MAFQISDAAAPMPLLRKQSNQTADDSRTQTKKVIVTRRDPKGPEEKSTFMIRVFSGTTNEDLVLSAGYFTPHSKPGLKQNA
jgi:hypothetical protein